MSEMNNAQVVKEQYKRPQHLNTRISIHQKYSVNKQGFGPWIVTHYAMHSGMKVLELGCGTGDMWAGHLDLLQGSSLVLTDLSQGMLEAAQTHLGQHPGVSYRLVDIQAIPYPDHTFDMVLAHMMLYHVPDLNKGLNEVRRVLKPSGKFHCATYGEHGMLAYLASLLPDSVQDTASKNFTLQNGQGILEEHFSNVQRFTYEDALAVTNLDDLVDYLDSLPSRTPFDTKERESVKQLLSQQMKDGVLMLPKEYGMFTAW